MTDVERNKQVVRDFCATAFNAKDPVGAAERFLGSQYIQHNPNAPDGKEGFVEFVSAFVSQTPELNLDIRRIVAEDDIVVAHSLLTVVAGDRGTVVVDIFRLDDNKIVEHWDVTQPFPETSANDHPMF